MSHPYGFDPENLREDDHPHAPPAAGSEHAGEMPSDEPEPDPILVEYYRIADEYLASRNH
tara:strand:+ start:17954 stop:18133 length:180 start_codon:yes stop_codon:yes gene_type:complete